MTDSLSEIDRLRELGRAAIRRRAATAGVPVEVAIPTIRSELTRARARRRTFIIASWVAGASQTQIGHVLGVAPQTIATHLKAKLPPQFRTQISTERSHFGREFLRFDQVELMRNLFEAHQEWDESNLIEVTKQFVDLANQSPDPDLDEDEGEVAS